MRFLVRLAVTAAALWVAVRLVPGIDYRGDWLPFLAVALVFGVVNAVVRPILFALTCPIVLLTLGLFVFVLNGVMLLITAGLAGAFGIDFTVEGLIPAILGALVVGLVSTVLSVFVGEPASERKS
jgi:putative membrane protein